MAFFFYIYHTGTTGYWITLLMEEGRDMNESIYLASFFIYRS